MKKKNQKNNNDKKKINVDKFYLRVFQISSQKFQKRKKIKNPKE